MDTWEMALKVAMIGFSAVFLGLLMLTAGVKVMSFCCRLAIRREKKEEQLQLSRNDRIEVAETRR